MNIITAKKNESLKTTCKHCNLEKICFSSGLSADGMANFERATEKTLKVKKKQPVFKRGDRLDSIYAIKSGSIKTSITSARGQVQVLGFHLPSHLIGFDGFADSRHTCDAIALEDTLLCELSLQDFESLCDVLPSMRKIMLQQVGAEISRHHNIALTLGQMQTEERLATYLLRLSCSFKRLGYSCLSYNLPMPRHDLANFLGMAPETLSRMFARLEQANIMQINKREITILDLDGLQKLSHELCSADDNL